MQSSPSDIAIRLFSHEPGSYGIIDANLGSDNEKKFQILIQIVLAGISLKNIQINELVSNETLIDFNQHFMWLGYKAHVIAVSYEDLSKLVYYCSINEHNRLFLNRFHPFRLMDGMTNNIPTSYNKLFNDEQYLNKIFAIRRYTNGAILTYFKKVNIVLNNYILD